MAIDRFKKIQNEAIDARSRLFIQRWDVYQVDVNSRMAQLKNLIGSSPDDEINRHVVVSAIAALQTFIRGTIIATTNFSDAYRERAAILITEKVSLTDALAWFNEKSVTFGELAAHFSSCNRLTDIELWMTGLLNCNLRQELAKAVSEYDQRNGVLNPKLIVSDVDKLYDDMNDIFRLRHIFAHEAASSLRISTDDCKRMWQAVSTLMKGINSILWSTVYKNSPLTQMEMTLHAVSDWRKARIELAQIMRRALNLHRKLGNSNWIRENHAEWSKVTKDWYKNTYSTLNGTMWASVKGTDHATVIRSRVKQVTQWVDLQEI